MLAEGKIADFDPFGDKRVPLYCADINVAETAGSIMLEEVEEQLDKRNITFDIQSLGLIREIQKSLIKFGHDKELLQRLVRSF